MKDEYAELSLIEALAVMQRGAPVIRKTEEVDTRSEGGKMHYNFAGLNTVWAAIADLMDDLGLIWTARTDILELEGGQSRFVLRYRLVHLPTEEEISGVYPLKGERPQDIGSAITYGRRYALVAVLNLRVAEDDDDAQAAEERSQLSPSAQAQASRPRKASAQRAPARPRQAPAPVPEGGAQTLSRARQSAMFAALGELGLTEREPIMEYVNETLAKHGATAVVSSKELSDESAGWVIERAKAANAGPPDEEG